MVWKKAVAQLTGTVEKSDVLALVLGGPLPSKWSVSCDSNKDTELLNRLPLLGELLCDLVESTYQVSTWKDDSRTSASLCGKEAYEYLVNVVDVIVNCGYIDDEDVRSIFAEYLKGNSTS